MLLRIFRGTGPEVVILIFLVSLGVWAGALIDPRIPSSFLYDEVPMPLYTLLKTFTGKSAIISSLVSFILVLIMAVLLVSFNTTVFFINERTFLPAVIYILLTGIFPYHQVLNPVLPASVLLMAAIIRIMEAYRKNGTAFNFFDASVLIGTGSLFYANLIWFGLLAIIGIAILRMGNVKELLLAIVGLCTPLIITAGIYYVAGKDMAALLLDARHNLFSDAGGYYFSRITIAGLAITGIALLAAILYLFSVLNSKKIKSRKTFTELLWLLLIAFTVYFAVPSVSVEIIFIAAIPMSYIFAHYFVFAGKRILPGIFFPALFIFVLIVQVIYLRQ